MTKFTRRQWASAIGEGIHTGFRKGTDHPKSSEYWNMISKMPDDLWNQVLDYCVWGLGYMGFMEFTEEEEV